MNNLKKKRKKRKWKNVKKKIILNQGKHEIFNNLLTI